MTWDFWRPKKPVTVGDVPHFSHPFCVDWFERLLKGHDRYVEYGTGGSTVLASKIGIPTVSMESDAKFLELVKAKLTDLSLLDETVNQYLHRDIGPVGRWGRPKSPNNSRYFEAFRKYSDFPPGDFGGRSVLVLVDGRFRVAAALKAARGLCEAQGSIVVDDYLGRKEYHVLERFLELKDLVGVMAVFALPQAHTVFGEEFEKTLRDFELVSD